jgi:hypothetical protein
MRLIASTLLFVLACGGGDHQGADDAPTIDATDALDGSQPDSAPDAPGGLPLPGFGAISGMCGVLTPTELDGTTPLWFQGQLDFANDRYDDPAERSQLTPGGVEIIVDGNAGGSSLYSEVFAFEWLARCELATLLKTETEILYDVDGKKADLLVEIDGRKVGVSVTRAVKYPFGQPYSLDEATPLIERKLDDLQLATTQVAVADRWATQMLAILAFNAQHAQVAMQAWSMLDAQTRGSTILLVVVTEGDAMFIYTDQ